MLSILLAMLGIVAAGRPGRRVRRLPAPRRRTCRNAPWVGDALRKGVDRLPTLDNQATSERDRRGRGAARTDRAAGARDPSAATRRVMGYPRA